MTKMTIREVKAKLPRLLSRLQKTRRSILVVKRGKPLATLVPCVGDRKSALASFRGTVARYGDIVAPTGATWDAAR